MKILTDANPAPAVEQIIDQAFAGYTNLNLASENWRTLLFEFLSERVAHVFERRGYRPDEAKAVAAFWKTPQAALKRVEALSKERGSAEFAALAALLKRV